MWLVWRDGVLHAQREEKTAPVRICRHARTHASTHARKHASTHARTHASARACTHARMHNVYVHVYVYVCCMRTWPVAGSMRSVAAAT